MVNYYSPMDRAYYGNPQRDSLLEKPIFTIGDLGQTVAEKDQSGRGLIQNVEAAIRAGATQLQVVLTVPHQAPFGGRPKGYGKDVRQALKEVLYVNQAKLVGLEMPTSSLNNMSGWDVQRGRFDEEVRKSHIDEVKDAIQFLREIGQGGGVDIVAFEFQRPLFDQSWNQDNTFQIPKEKEEGEIRFVDSRTGQIIPIRIGEGLYRNVDKEGKPLSIDPKTQLPILERWDFQDFKEFAKKQGRSEESAYDDFKRALLENQKNVARAEASRLRNLALDAIGGEERLREIDQKRTAGQQLTPEENADFTQYTYFTESAVAQARTVKEIDERIEHWTPIDKFAISKTADSYAEAAVSAYLETKKGGLQHELYVGPEISWPTYYGSHPDEFITIVNSAREKFKERLKEDFKISDPKQLDALSKRHVKGLFDTGHMGMWLQYFRPDITDWDDRVKEFNKWYLEQVDKLIKADVVGSIQAVDSKSGAHGHLPPGQGIFPVVEAVTRFKKKGFDGFIVSEGHEEELVNPGRILLKTWEAFNAQIAPKYGAALTPPTWRDIDHGYVARIRAPQLMFGAYTPPFGEYKPWSEIPFE